MDKLVSNVSELCKDAKRFHGAKREKELESLTKYMKEFKDFSADEFVSFVCRQYIDSLRKCKRFCSQSIYNRVSAIQSRLDINVMSRGRYLSVLKNLRKLFNPYNTETDFYTCTGSRISMPVAEFQELRQNAKILIEQNQTNVPDRWILNTYTDEEIETIYNYFRLNLENFLKTDRLPHTFDQTFVELCMLIVFSYNTPRRITEIINLQLDQIEHLITHNTVNIKSKDGFSIDCIYISVALADILNRYIQKLYPDIFKTKANNFRIFSSSYKMYYSRMRTALKTLIGEDRLRNLRIFHGFRNYYAKKHFTGETTTQCQRILGHRKESMTKKYARGQRVATNVEDQQKTRVLDYLNSSTT